jgi:hypothetical protein
MQRIFLHFVSLVLFLSQTLVVLHAAEEQLEKHEHNGKVCVLYLYGEQTSSDDLLHATLLVPVVLSEQDIAGSTGVVLSLRKYAIKVPRAPPTTSPV